MTCRGAVNTEELRIVLVGKTGAGKSATGSTILGRKAFRHLLSVVSVTKECSKERGEVKGEKVAVVDTPGWFDTRYEEEKVIEDVKQCINFAAPGPHAFLVVIRLGRFTQEEKKSVEIIQTVFGEEAAKYSMVLFTHGDQLDEDQTIEDVLTGSSELSELISKCNGRYHVFSNKDKDSTQVTELMQKIKKMVEGNGGSHYTNEMFQEAQRAIEEETQKILKEKEEEIRKKEMEIKKKFESQLNSALEEEKKRLKRKYEEEERLKRKYEEKERLKREHEEKERLKREHEEKERLKREHEEEKERLKRKYEEKERLKREYQEKERLKREHEEKERQKGKHEEEERQKREYEEKKERLKREYEEEMKNLREREKQKARDQAERRNKSTFLGGLIGVISGAAVGAIVAGPVGAVVGACGGLPIGAVTGHAASD